jgi:hypothetical protein
MPLFDAYIFVDWGAAGRPYSKTPKADALWVGELSSPDDQKTEKYCCTREEATQHVLDRLLHHTEESRRVLVGFDFPYGYPKGLASALNLTGDKPAWLLVWSEISRRIEDDENNCNDRFRAASDLNRIISGNSQGPFWGSPKPRATGHLSPHSPGFPFHAANNTSLERLRICERMLHGVQEVWGLYGAGRVGSQALLGIPRVRFLRFHPELREHSRIWPFETGFISSRSPVNGPFILHAEIWPGLVRENVDRMKQEDPKLILDQAQVAAMCRWAWELDAAGELGRLFDIPAGLTAEQQKVCVEEEGWILGLP